MKSDCSSSSEWCNALSSFLSCTARVVWRSMFSCRFFNPACTLYQISNCSYTNRNATTDLVAMYEGFRQGRLRDTRFLANVGSWWHVFLYVFQPHSLNLSLYARVLSFRQVRSCDAWRSRGHSSVTYEATNPCSSNICCRTSSSGILWIKYRLSTSPLTSIHFLVMVGWGIEITFGCEQALVRWIFREDYC